MTMSITQHWEKIKGNMDVQGILDKNTFWSVFVVLVAIISFGLGRSSGLETVQGNTVIEFPKGQEAGAFIGTFATTTPKALPVKTSGIYLASKNGTKYYLPTCASSNRISAANKIWFDSKLEAENAGYTPAANCKGI